MTRNDLLTYAGITQPITEWALDYGITPAVIIARLERGLSTETAITAPMVIAQGQRLHGDYLDEYITGRAPRKRRKTRPARRYSFNGQCLTVLEWAERTGVSIATINYRLRTGWSIEDALSRPKLGTVPGVVSNLCRSSGTGAGSTAQEIPEIKNPEKADPA